MKTIQIIIKASVWACALAILGEIIYVFTMESVVDDITDIPMSILGLILFTLLLVKLPKSSEFRKPYALLISCNALVLLSDLRLDSEFLNFLLAWTCLILQCVAYFKLSKCFVKRSRVRVASIIVPCVILVGVLIDLIFITTFDEYNWFYLFTDEGQREFTTSLLLKLLVDCAFYSSSIVFFVAFGKYLQSQPSSSVDSTDAIDDQICAKEE